MIQLRDPLPFEADAVLIWDPNRKSEFLPWFNIKLVPESWSSPPITYEEVYAAVETALDRITGEKL